MGLSFRGRTKGKGSWINYSWTPNNGFHASLSIKPAKSITINASTKGLRGTVDLPGGFRYTTSRAKVKTKTVRKEKEYDSRFLTEIKSWPEMTEARNRLEDSMFWTGISVIFVGIFFMIAFAVGNMFAMSGIAFVLMFAGIIINSYRDVDYDAVNRLTEQNKLAQEDKQLTIAKLNSLLEIRAANVAASRI